MPDLADSGAKTGAASLTHVVDWMSEVAGQDHGGTEFHSSPRRSVPPSETCDPLE